MQLVRTYEPGVVEVELVGDGVGDAGDFGTDEAFRDWEEVDSCQSTHGSWKITSKGTALE